MSFKNDNFFGAVDPYKLRCCWSIDPRPFVYFKQEQRLENTQIKMRMNIFGQYKHSVDLKTVNSSPVEKISSKTKGICKLIAQSLDHEIKTLFRIKFRKSPCRY